MFFSLVLFRNFILIVRELIRKIYFKFHSKFDGDTELDYRKDLINTCLTSIRYQILFGNANMSNVLVNFCIND